MDAFEWLPKAKKELNALLEQAKQDKDVLAVILFGSAVRDELHERSDIDVCLVLCPKRWEVEKLAQKRFEYLTWILNSSSNCLCMSEAGCLRKVECCSSRTKTNFTKLPSALQRSLRISSTFIVTTLRRSPVIDRERILAKLAELDGYLNELS